MTIFINEEITATIVIILLMLVLAICIAVVAYITRPKPRKPNPYYIPQYSIKKPHNANQYYTYQYGKKKIYKPSPYYMHQHSEEKQCSQLPYNNDYKYDVGIAFENQVYEYLSAFDFLSLYHNISIKDTRLNSVQIDLIAILPNAIYVIECKNWSGTVVGNSKWSRWLQIKKFKPFGNFAAYKNVNLSCTEIYSPILQNNAHINALSVYLASCHIDNIEFVNIVLYSDAMSMALIENDTNAKIIKYSDLKSFFDYELDRTRSCTIKIDKFKNSHICTALKPYSEKWINEKECE